MQHRQNHYIFVVFVILKIFLQYSPALDYHASASINFPILVFLFLYIFFYDKAIIRRTIGLILPIYILPFLNAYAASWGNTPMINLVYLILQWFVWPLVAFFSVKNLSVKSMKIITLSFLLCFSVTAITTYVGCLQFPNAARVQANGNFVESNPETVALYRSLNIGGFLFAYTAVPMLPLLLYLYRNGTYNKWVVFGLLILYSVAIYETQYATAFLIGLVALLFLLLPLRLTPRNISKRIFVAVILAILFLPIIALLFETISKSVDSEILSQRFQELSLFSNNESSLDEDSDLGTRFQLWTSSFKGFLEHPITGCYVLGKTETLKWFGGHSFILDAMCRFGILGLFFVVLMFRRIYKLFLLPYRHHPIYIYAYVAYWINIIQCLLNTTTAEIILVFLVPLLVCVSVKYTIK